MATEAAAARFFSSPAFAVVGASSNPAKYGHKVHAWYLNHELPVTPINPASPSVTVNGSEHQTLSDVKSLHNPKQTSVSIITHPAVTLGVIKDAISVGVPAVWLQPGTFDDSVLELALAEGAFEAVLYGQGGHSSEGWCVLVDGERALKAAARL